ncbi:DUF7344 domain-containing protein [Natronoarchaeum rubrum]|uniref:DUF7344 domain-containing protein n=1 Tax=Natronoarchaeum rubrum TaxID=755311 RepID=UPI0021128ACA|nr:hypothetical protein [Natronoarchaeum rubrum]HMB49680.1 hypothetical protein [Natronoarchaeum rubrum]
MTTDTADPERNCIDPGLRADVIFDVLNHPRRRHALYYLAEAVGAVPLAELADAVAEQEGTPTAERRQRVATGLYHTHLPKFDETGVAEYDPRTDIVTLSARAATALAPYLELAARDDIRADR